MGYQKGKVMRWCFGLLILIIIVGAGGYIRNEFPFDGRSEKKSEERDYQKEVQDSADESMFKVRINSLIELDTPEDEAPLYIRNIKENKYDTYVELISDETQKVVYESRTLKPGDSILKDKLSGLPKKGSHPYTARFHVLEDGKEISSIEYAIMIEMKGGETDG